ncbi:uncharacterized protein C8Q71DRAFT_786048 [Rhodofomes roseus]|uniref:DUF3140 domain-containing protein n=1 Tax=Rhodofomes roseus TaxID=34475 RepID=A0ABQ8K1E7_9APHY|nr:uncharacterized protein C8Q71DRAFT_786048 [Rhodofomes roseus]KAH9830489.1 hypothetical protein C8Q71DRAFT_786048 [Rhodofomes roseus]
MVKSRDDVIAQFNEDVNMSVDELQQWLDDPKSTKAGTGVGIESGHKIIEILKKNPDKDPEKYDDEDIEHMRKVVSYSARHLAQEDKLKETKTKEELENTKSTISLRNWGHDPIKTLDENEGAANGEGTDKNAERAEQGRVNGAKHDEKITANGEKKANKGVELEQKEQTQASSKRKLGEGGGEAEVAEEAANEDGGYEDEDPSDAAGEQEGPRKRTKTTENDTNGEKADSA